MLTSFIKDNPDVRERFNLEFIRPDFVVPKPLLAPPRSKRSSHIGTAFDYLLRFRLTRINPHTVQCRGWIAENAIEFLTGVDGQPDSPFLPAAKTIIADAKNNAAIFLKTGELSAELFKSSLLLATLDAYVRSFDGNEEFIGVIHDEDIQELQSISDLVNEKDFTAQRLCLLNPTFGSASDLVEGADADLVIDDVLIDIKTTKSPKLELSAFRQIIGYYVLHQLGGVGGLNPKPSITKVGIYFSRYGYLHKIPITDIVNPDTFPDFLRWFERRAKE